MSNYEKINDQIAKSRENLFGKNLDPEVRPGWGALPTMNLDPTRIIKCEIAANGECVPTANVVEVTEEK